MQRNATQRKNYILYHLNNSIYSFSHYLTLCLPIKHTKLYSLYSENTSFFILSKLSRVIL